MYYVNGNYVKEEDAKISVFDLAILRGFGVFDFFRTYRGKPFHLWDHLLRLKCSADHIGLELPNSLTEIASIVLRVLELNAFSEACVKIVLTGGISPDHFMPHPRGNLIVFAYPLTPYPTKFYTEGIKVITTPLFRSLPMSKTIQYIPAIVAFQKGRSQNADEVLYVNTRKEILEATTSNFFAFKEGILYTCCTEEVLTGITREVILRLLDGHVLIERRALRMDEIPLIEEAFVTSSNKEVMPVVQIDDHLIHTGKVGPKTQKIIDLFRTYTENDEWPQLSSFSLDRQL